MYVLWDSDHVLLLLPVSPRVHSVIIPFLYFPTPQTIYFHFSPFSLYNMSGKDRKMESKFWGLGTAVPGQAVAVSLIFPRTCSCSRSSYKVLGRGILRHLWLILKKRKDIFMHQVELVARGRRFLRHMQQGECCKSCPRRWLWVHSLFGITTSLYCILKRIEFPYVLKV